MRPFLFRDLLGPGARSLVWVLVMEFKLKLP